MLESLHDMIFYWVDSVNITPYHLNWNVRKIYSNRGEYISRIIVLISVNWVQLPKIPPNKNCNLFASGLYILFQLFVQMIINILSFHEVSLGLDFNSNWRNNLNPILKILMIVINTCSIGCMKMCRFSPFVPTEWKTEFLFWLRSIHLESLREDTSM